MIICSICATGVWKPTGEVGNDGEKPAQIGLWLAAASAVVFGALTIVAGRLALFGGPASQAAADNAVWFVIWFNFRSGFVSVLAGMGVALRKPRGCMPASDVRDAEWAVVGLLLACRVKLRQIWDARRRFYRIFFRQSRRCANMPTAGAATARFRGSTRHWFFWRARRKGREGPLRAGIIDSQSVITTESGGIPGYDAGKRIKGRKRHIMGDTCGNLLAIRVDTASIQDRDAPPEVFVLCKRDAARLSHALTKIGRWVAPTVKRSDTATDFEVILRRRVLIVTEN